MTALISAATEGEAMMKKNPYPNMCYVNRWSPAHKAWVPILESVGNKSYTQGYINALDSFQPHWGYQFIDKDGGLFELRRGRGAAKVNYGVMSVEVNAATQCECRLCQRYRRIRAAIKSRDVDELIALVNGLVDELCNVGEDAEVNEAIIDGWWPSADQIIHMRRVNRARQEAANGG